MAAPNIVAVATINGKSAVAQDIGTGGTTVVTNAAASGLVFKVNAVFASNTTGSDTSVSVYLLRSSVEYAICQSIVLPSGTTLDVLGSSVYLEEDDSLKVVSGIANSVDAVVSYEEIS